MLKTFLALAAAVVAAVAIGFGFRESGAGSDGVAVPAAAQAESVETIRLLREELRRERSERLELAARVTQLEEASPAAKPRSIETPASRRHSEPPASAPASNAELARGFPEEKLLEAGFDRAEVRAYRERIDGIELERLYLRDRAAREGWLDTSRYKRESAELSRSLRATRDEFGDELYDWALFTSGHPNRVTVADVMEGSPAALAGLEAGDVLVRYGERPIFSPRELREETLAGRPGETTAVEVVRRGEARRLFVPRGPLGIRTDTIVQEPAG